jgi:release factor glutamine methyltransferase
LKEENKNMPLPTPSTSHIPISDFETKGIYSPAEDSFLILDTLASEVEGEFLRRRFSSQYSPTTSPVCSTSVSTSTADSTTIPGPRASTTPLILEVGTGSGVIIAFLTAHAKEILGREDVLCLAGDVNLYAAMEARRTVEEALGEKRGEGRQGENTNGLESEGDGYVDAELRPVSTLSNTNPIPSLPQQLQPPPQAQIQTESQPDSNSRSHPPRLPPIGLFLDVILSDLTTALKPGSIDLLVFNPPYVPTEFLPDVSKYSTPNPTQESSLSISRSPNSQQSSPHSKSASQLQFEKQSHLNALTYAGGQDGMQTTSRLLSLLDSTLSPRGVAYVLFCARNRVGNVIEELKRKKIEGEEKGKWEVCVAGETGGKGGWERLSVLRIWRG